MILGGWYLHRRASLIPSEITQAQVAPPRTHRKSEIVSAQEQIAIFEDFSRWTEQFVSASTDDRPAIVAAGIKLTLQRRALMEDLIQSDPKQALEKAVKLHVWQSLPPEIRREVEEPFSALADYKVYPVCTVGTPNRARQPISDATRLTAIADHAVLDTYVFGRRMGMQTKDDSPVQGIRLGSKAALREGVFHELSAAEADVVATLYPLANSRADRDFATGGLLSDSPVTALAGGRIFIFADRAGFENFENMIAKLDESPGPHSGASVLFLPFPAGEFGGFDFESAVIQSNLAASAWTETKKKLLMIRCDFSDKPSSSNPVVDSGSYGTLLNTTVSNHIRDFSYGKTWIEATVSNSVIRLPQTAAYYATNVGGGTTRNNDLLSQAKTAYLAANPSFVASNYDIIGVWFVEIGMTQGGFAYGGLAGGGDLWIQGNSSVDLHVHELGHNYGIGHSSFWKPSVSSLNPVDLAGTNDEYGDDFDVMGSGPAPEGVFHSEAKKRLNWLAAGEWTDATAGGNGTYRLHRIDHPNTGGVRGLRATKGAGEYYWLSYRRLFSNSWLKAGANIVWQRNGLNRSWLIDTTPGSVPGASDRDDGALTIGRTYSDGNLHITALARGGEVPNEYLDIKVNTGPFPGNVAPTVLLTGPSTISARQTCFLSAQATDANGDELAYSWDFGQGFTFDNHSTAAFAWNSGGTYTVKVTVSDMKGNIAQATKIITVTDAITTWTARENSSTGDFNALVASPSKVLAVGEDYYVSARGPIATSLDGLTWTATQLGVNQHTNGGVWDGSQFLIAGQDYDFTGTPGWRGCVFTSPTANAGTWTRRIYSGSTLKGIAFGNAIYVAVGENGCIWRSINSTTWTQITSGTTRTLANVTYGNGTFVIVGYASAGSGDSLVLTSTDGLTWTNTSAGTGLDSWQDFRSITWANDRFLASGWYGKLRHSTNLGVSFSTTRSTTEDTPALAYGSGVWFAAGRDRNNVDPLVDIDIDLVSSDGANWTPLTTPSLDDRTAAIFFNNTFITAGKNHSIRQSGTISPSANGYYTWRENNFPDHDPLSTPQADRDGDGISNLIEYALGSSPLSGSANNGPAALPQALTAAPEALLNGRLALQVNLPNPAASDLIHVVEAASSPAGTWTPLATKVGTGAWTWNPGGTSRIILGTPASGRIVVKVGDSVAISAGSRRFLRLKTYPNQ